MPRNDVAIYTPTAASIYEARVAAPAGGAERQAHHLALGLARRELRVAHVVFAVDELRVPHDPRLTVVQRPRPPDPGPSVRRRVRETAILWRAFDAADAAVYVVRIGSAALGAAATYCRVRRRRLIFAAAGNMDFTMSALTSGRAQVLSYKAGLRLVDAVVVQTDEQLRLGRALFGDAPRVEVIPSFGDPAPQATAEPEAFLWVGRLVPEKRPLEYVELARAVPEARFRMIAWETNQTPAQLSAELRELAAGVDNLELLPGLPHDATLDLLGRAVASVNTSETEGMPNTFLEAWARGIPVLTLEFDPDGRIREHGLGITADGSPEAFAAAARALWAEPARRAEIGMRARDYIDRTHAPEVVTARWHALVRDLTR